MESIVRLQYADEAPDYRPGVRSIIHRQRRGAQFGRFGDTSPQAHLARPSDYDGKFHYCRAVYRPNPRGDGGNWLTDYPLADIDLSIRVAELTKIAVAFDAPHQPRHLIVQLTSDELFQCPVIIMQEVGRLFFTSDDAARLRTYLLKGGFLWVDDFWGSYAWDVWEAEIRKVFPATSTRSSICHARIRCITRCSISKACRRFPPPAYGSAAGKRRSAAPTARRCTRAGSQMPTAA
jgi:hypothetical protein